MLERIGAQHVLVGEHVRAADVLSVTPFGVDAALDLLGSARLLDSMAMVRVGGRVCVAGSLAGGHLMEDFEPIFQLPSGVHLSAFASALAFGSASYPLSAIPSTEFGVQPARMELD